jgi:hypothetical protein
VGQLLQVERLQVVRTDGAWISQELLLPCLPLYVVGSWGSLVDSWDSLLKCTWDSLLKCTWDSLLKCTWDSLLKCTWDSLLKCTWDSLLKCTWPAGCGQQHGHELELVAVVSQQGRCEFVFVIVNM